MRRLFGRSGRRADESRLPIMYSSMDAATAGGVVNGSDSEPSPEWMCDCSIARRGVAAGVEHYGRSLGDLVSSHCRIAWTLSPPSTLVGVTDQVEGGGRGSKCMLTIGHSLEGTQRDVATNPTLAL